MSANAKTNSVGKLKEYLKEFDDNVELFFGSGGDRTYTDLEVRQLPKLVRPPISARGKLPNKK